MIECGSEERDDDVRLSLGISVELVQDVESSFSSDVLPFLDGFTIYLEMFLEKFVRSAQIQQSGLPDTDVTSVCVRVSVCVFVIDTREVFEV